jgi:hypothetical protein
MKKNFILIIAIASSAMVNAQLANTSWKGKFYIPDANEMVLQFKTDTLLLKYPDGSMLESMSYKINNDTLSIRKIEGPSECSYSENATYKIETKDEKLFIKALNDSCSARADVWSSEGLEKVEPGD